MQRPNIKPYLKGGALGGALGLLLWLILIRVLWTSIGVPEDSLDLMTEGFPPFLLIGRVPFTPLFIFSCVVGVIGGAIEGVVISYFIWQWAARIGKNPHPAVRVLIGVGFRLGLSSFTLITHWQRGQRAALVSDLLYAFMVGILAGLLARSKSTMEARAEARSDKS